MIRKIATQAVYVDDQQAALKFWTEIIGFEKRVETDMGNGSSWLEVAPEGAETALVLYPKSLMPDWSEKQASIVFSCENIEQYCTELREKGVVFSQELNEMSWGKFAVFQDPEGQQFVLKG